MITITSAAAQKIFDIAQASEKEVTDTGGLRIAVRGGGCSGLEYDMRLEDAPGDNDIEFNEAGVNIFIDKKSALYLDGLEIDWLDGLMESGFKITNPNATTTCGCGQSFR